MEKPNTRSIQNSVINGMAPLWVEGHALVAAFGRFWPPQKKLEPCFSYETAALGR